MVKCFVMCGLPASGKSWQAKKLAVEYDAEIFSSDSLREEVFGDVNHQADNDALFKELHKRIRECLAFGKNAIYDACNISVKRRMEFLKSLNKIPCEKIAVMMATPYEVCIERNKHRERKVPEEVIKRMYMNFWVPAKYEGFDEIEVEYSGFGGYYGTPRDFYNKYKDYNQHNSHHTLTLGKHCFRAASYIFEHVEWWQNCRNELYCAALLHDCQKPFCESFTNAKGEITEECHYYGHEHPSAYNSLFYDFYNYGYGVWINQLYIAQLIQWHMRPYTAWEKSEKAREKDRRLLGETLFNDICLLNKADIYAH